MSPEIRIAEIHAFWKTQSWPGKRSENPLLTERDPTQLAGRYVLGGKTRMSEMTKAITAAGLMPWKYLKRPLW